MSAYDDAVAYLDSKVHPRCDYDIYTDMRDIVDEMENENAKLREQMEWLVTLLRDDCDIDASWDGLRHFWSIGLTEGGCLMRDRACKAEAENAKLRMRLAQYELFEDVIGDPSTEFARLRRELHRLQRENAKLRELCAVMRAETPVLCRFEGCRDSCPNTALCEREAELVSELGIEVGQ